MNNKENAVAGERGLSAEQRARISQKFRSAKALLDRKRPRLSLSASRPFPREAEDARKAESPGRVCDSRRFPLSENRTNSIDNSIVGDSIPEVHYICESGNNKKIRNEDASFLRSHVTPLKQEESHNLCSGSEAGPCDHGNNSFSTPVRQHSNVGFAESLESSAVSVLDDSFDDVILEEIDALCEKSAAQSERAVSNSTSAETLPIDWKTEEGNETTSHMDTSEKVNDTVDNFSGNQVGGSRNSVAALPNSMPDEYSKYTKSLNERQQDALCEKSASQSERAVSNSTSAETLPIDWKTEEGNETTSHMVTSEKVNDTVDNFSGDQVGGSRISVAALPNSIPDEYSKYMKSLDERQQDALCEKSAAQSERAVSNSTSAETPPIDWKTEEGNETTSHMVTSEKVNDTVDNFSGDQVGGSRISVAALPNSMPDEYLKYMKSLNERQQDAACSDISTPLMIVAGPGSGKTSTMVGRILMLLSQGISPSNILAMTFTTAAASEMRERIGSVAGKASAKELTISTFHSFSLQLCRLHAEKLGRTAEFSIYGHGQQRRAVIEAARLFEDGKKRSNCESEQIERVGVSSPQHFKDKSKKWLKFVTQAKASGKTPEDYDKMGNEIGALILRNYNGILKSCNALDYHDLISCSVRLLDEYPEVFKHSQESWKAIVIDEFQDTSAMQYSLLRILASHKRITIVGDEDQSIFSFNGADALGFDSFRNDFLMHKEVKLNRNYRSTRYIVEAATSLIRNNLRRCQSKDVLTENSCGSKLIVKECSNENSQCAFVVDKICEIVSENSSVKCSFGNIAVLYRRQVSGKIFQTTFRSRKIPFNNHGVAFYRKKVVKAIISMLRTALPSCDDGDYRRVFKALLPSEKEEKKKVVEHIDKVATVRKCSFISAAIDIFSAKVSGTFKRAQLTQGKKVLLTIDMIKKLVHREQSISAVISSVASMIPQKYLLEQRAVLDNDSGKLLNEDNDLRSVLEYLLDDVSDFLTNQHNYAEKEGDELEGKGCAVKLQAFIDLISERERENFRSRRHDNKNSVTLTTIHQSKGLEWDVVFIVKVNESEIPLMHEFDGVTNGNGALVEEERRLLYVAMTRARKRLFILYLTMDSNWQVLQPSRFLREIPHHLVEIQEEHRSEQGLQLNNQQLPQETCQNTAKTPAKTESIEHDTLANDLVNHLGDEVSKKSTELVGAYNANEFLRRFSIDDRAVVSQLFHKWAKKPAFQDPKRLLDKVMFVIDERLRAKKCNHKDVLRSLRSCLHSDEQASEYAISVLKWEQIPADQRAHIVREKQEHFQKQRIESAMGSSTPTSKQIAYLQSLGCTVTPTSRLHASRLIEQYKSL